MSTLTFIDKQVLESLFSMGSGYVLDFSDKAFNSFFRDVAGINIREDSFTQLGTSKANRLRYFWDQYDDKTVGKVLDSLIQYVELKSDKGTPHQTDKAKQIVKRLLNIKTEDSPISEFDFLKQDFGDFDISGLPMESIVIEIMTCRIKELQECLKNKISLASIFLSGSILEGLLLGSAQIETSLFNKAKSAPKDTRTNATKKLHEWSLSNFIDVATELQILTLDIKKFSHVLREFRNYIHPYEQASSGFKPDFQTAIICQQVLKAAIFRFKTYYLKEKVNP